MDSRTYSVGSLRAAASQPQTSHESHVLCQRQPQRQCQPVRGPSRRRSDTGATSAGTSWAHRSPPHPPHPPSTGGRDLRASLVRMPAGPSLRGTRAPLEGRPHHRCARVCGGGATGGQLGPLVASLSRVPPSWFSPPLGPDSWLRSSAMTRSYGLGVQQVWRTSRNGWLSACLLTWSCRHSDHAQCWTACLYPLARSSFRLRVALTQRPLAVRIRIVQGERMADLHVRHQLQL